MMSKICNILIGLCVVGIVAVWITYYCINGKWDIWTACPEGSLSFAAGAWCMLLVTILGDLIHGPSKKEEKAK